MSAVWLTIAAVLCVLSAAGKMDEDVNFQNVFQSIIVQNDYTAAADSIVLFVSFFFFFLQRGTI